MLTDKEQRKAKEAPIKTAALAYSNPLVQVNPILQRNA